MIASPAPDCARFGQWKACQSVARPYSDEYWHIGAMTMRLDSDNGPIARGENRRLMEKERPYDVGSATIPLPRPSINAACGTLSGMPAGIAIAIC